MLVKKEVKPVKVILACDECGTEMNLDENTFGSAFYPYSYTCPKCGYRIPHLAERYPRIEYEEIE